MKTEEMPPLTITNFELNESNMFKFYYNKSEDVIKPAGILRRIFLRNNLHESLLTLTPQKMGHLNETQLKILKNNAALLAPSNFNIQLLIEQSKETINRRSIKIDGLFLELWKLREPLLIPFTSSSLNIPSKDTTAIEAYYEKLADAFESKSLQEKKELLNKGLELIADTLEREELKDTNLTYGKASILDAMQIKENDQGELILQAQSNLGRSFINFNKH